MKRAVPVSSEKITHQLHLLLFHVLCKLTDGMTSVENIINSVKPDELLLVEEKLISWFSQ